MRIPLFVCTAIVSASAAWAAAQTAPSAPSEGLDLLQKVAQHYQQAQSYSIDSIEERTDTSDLSRNWSRQVLTAAEEPGGRFHFEGRTQSGYALRVSDGKTVWSYHAEQHRYTMVAAPV